MNEWRKNMSQDQTAQTETIETLTREYHMECAKAGDLKYRIECFEDDLSACHDRMKKINQKAAKLKAQQVGQSVDADMPAQSTEAEARQAEVTQ